MPCSDFRKAQGRNSQFRWPSDSRARWSVDLDSGDEEKKPDAIRRAKHELTLQCLERKGEELQAPTLQLPASEISSQGIRCSRRSKMSARVRLRFPRRSLNWQSLEERCSDLSVANRGSWAEDQPNSSPAPPCGSCRCRTSSLSMNVKRRALGNTLPSHLVRRRVAPLGPGLPPP